MQRHLAGPAALVASVLLLATGCGSSSSVPAVASATPAHSSAATSAATPAATTSAATAAPTCAQLRATLTALVATLTSSTKTNAEKGQDALAAGTKALALARNGDGALKAAVDKLGTDLKSLSTALSNGESIASIGSAKLVTITGDVLSITALCTT